jgi:flagellar hook assembly protein FlgD
VFKVQGAKELMLEIFALDGRQVVAHSRFVEFAAGQQQLEWDGRGSDGQLVPSGIYLARIEVDVDASNRRAQFICPISVVY